MRCTRTLSCVDERMLIDYEQTLIRFDVVIMILWFLSLMFAGVLAGLFVMGTAAVEPAARRLPTGAHLVLRQHLIARLRWLVPPLMTAVLVLAVGCALAAATPAGRALMSISSALIALILVTTFAGNVPINRVFSAADPTRPPAAWTRMIARWGLLDRVRCIATLIAFGLQILSLILEKTP